MISNQFRKELDSITAFVKETNELVQMLDLYEAERDCYRRALETISKWDQLNPPAIHLSQDLVWLKDLITKTLERK